MVHRLPRAVVGALLAAGLMAAPAHAKTSRVDAKLRAAERALDRASDSDSTVSALGTVRRNLAAAQKTALRKPAPATLGRVAAFEGEVSTTTVALYDGQTGDAVPAISTTLKAALDGRDAIVAAIDALADKSDYERVLASIHSDATGEADDIADTLSDDELTDEAKTALSAAATQVAATAAAPASSDDADYPGGATGDDDGTDCPPGQRGDDDAQYPGATSQDTGAGRGAGRS